MLHRKKFLFAGVSLVLLLFFYKTIDKNIASTEITFRSEDLNNKQIVPWGLEKIGVSINWSELKGKGIKVAVMDSGINFKHPDLSNNIKEGYNAIEPMKLPLDDFGHGTLVSGIIVAQNNSIGIVGIAPEAELYPIKVLDKYGDGDISLIENGIDWCIKNNIQIINMSFSIEENKPQLFNAVMKAINAGIIVVAASSNSYGSDVGYPAAYNNVISVTAIDADFNISKTSPRGKIDFSAPGVNVISTSKDGGYEECIGTSYATPYLTGIIALILQSPEKFGIPKNKKCSYSDIYNVLKGLAIRLGKQDIYGNGFVSLKNAHLDTK